MESSARFLVLVGPLPVLVLRLDEPLLPLPVLVERAMMPLFLLGGMPGVGGMGG